MQEQIQPVRPHSSKKHRLLLWLGIPLLLVVVALVVALEIFLHRAEPILRARVVETLSARFNSRVELSKFDVSLLRGFEVSGKGLAIYPNNLNSDQPIFSVDSFSFRTAYRNLLRTPMHIGHVDLQGLHINLPPKSARKDISMGGGPGQGSAGGDQSSEGDPSKIKISVGEIRCANALLVLETDKPGKIPLQFAISRLILRSVAGGKPMDFSATLVNPKPVGNIQSSGYFGPWNTGDPGSTAVGGSYSFRSADLSTLKGIGGILSSTGKYAGTLNQITVDGTTDTPDFEVNVSGHKVPLHTDFHAIVDGTNGDTYLQPVNAQFLNSSLTATGYVVRQMGEQGRHIFLDVAIDQGHIQDLLQLAVHSDPPFMDGGVKLHTKLEIPPGPQDIAAKLKLQGHFSVFNAHFSNQKVQSDVDELSLRGQGQPGMAHQEARNPQTANVFSKMDGAFDLANGILTIHGLNYQVPGAKIKLDGTYSLDGNKFDFFGTAALNATLSQVVGGWKGFMLKPFDRLLEKNGAGLQIPIKITGTRSAPHFGLDLHHNDPQEQK